MLARLALAARLNIDAQCPAPYEQSDPELWDDMRADLTSVKINDHFDLTAVVRAVLAAMREPSLPTLQAGLSCDNVDIGDVDLENEWQAMIDQILSGGE